MRLCEEFVGTQPPHTYRRGGKLPHAIRIGRGRTFGCTLDMPDWHVCRPQVCNGSPAHPRTLVLVPCCPNGYGCRLKILWGQFRVGSSTTDDRILLETCVQNA